MAADYSIMGDGQQDTRSYDMGHMDESGGHFIGHVQTSYLYKGTVYLLCYLFRLLQNSYMFDIVINIRVSQ
jgi:hypothetical protein